MGEDIVIHVEAETPEVEAAPEPVVIVASGFADSFPAEFEELTSLREFKRESDEARIAEAERVAAEALLLAEIAQRESLEVSEPEIIVEAEVQEDTPPHEDSEPDNEHPFFKKW